jgi:predicted transcriptional regulator of viral defense system
MPGFDATHTALAAFRRHGGMLSVAAALRYGIHPHTLYALRDAGRLEQISRGLYRLADMTPLSDPDLVVVALRVPRAVVCLISALALHELTTQIPNWVYVALPRGAAKPALDHPPLRIFWFSGDAYSAGVEVRRVDDTEVLLYNPAKTIADCFKYRNKIGLDVALEALRLYRKRRDFDVDALLHYARICRVARVMRPYMEALL